MALPILTGSGTVIADPDLRFTSSGVAVVNLRLAFNKKRKNESGEWEDVATLFLDCTAWRQDAEQIAEHLSKGMQVTVSGAVETQTWENREGEKRSKTLMNIYSIGPTVRQLDKHANRSGGGSDPWAGSGEPTEAPF